MNIGRKSRIWTNAQSRAIKERDQHCQWPGCTRTHHLPIHHLKHWADGGETSVSNGVCLCTFHHLMVHEGGYTIERVTDSEQRMNQQFEQQQHSNDTSLFDFEKDLRNDRKSFDTMRALSPTRYRFRVKNAQGVDIRALVDAPSSTDVCAVANPPGSDTPDSATPDSATPDSATPDSATSNASNSPPSYQPRHSTRIECGEPECGQYEFSTHSLKTTFTSEILPSAIEAHFQAHKDIENQKLLHYR